jgi:hypothetical protein
LSAKFDKKGELVSSFQKFKNKRLPIDVMVEIARSYNGSTVNESNSFANSKGWAITKEYYKIKIEDGNKIRKVRINRENDRLSIAGL